MRQVQRFTTVHATVGDLLNILAGTMPELGAIVIPASVSLQNGKGQLLEIERRIALVLRS